MFLVFLRWGVNRALAPQHVAGHKAWLAEGLADGVFLLAGSLQDGQGGLVLARGTTREALAARVQLDPFVAEGVVSAEIVAVTPSLADERLRFLMPKA